MSNIHFEDLSNKSHPTPVPEQGLWSVFVVGEANDSRRREHLGGSGGMPPGKLMALVVCEKKTG